MSTPVPTPVPPPVATPAISFEFFPPRSLQGSFRLWDSVQALAPLGPRFISVTYGAGGTTRELTREAVATLQQSTGLTVAAHLTCVNASRVETMAIAEQYSRAGIRDIVALRGDGFAPQKDGFADSCALIEALAGTGKFNIRVAAYPDIHPEARDLDADINWLKAKLDAGASEALTQFFFEAETFLRFRDACVKAGITAPITPGILPIENWAGARAFALRCGARVPDWLNDAFAVAKRDGRQDLLATAVCTELCADLVEEGVERLHFYTMNKPDMTRDVCHALGITAQARLQNVA